MNNSVKLLRKVEDRHCVLQKMDRSMKQFWVEHMMLEEFGTHLSPFLLFSVPLILWL